MVSLALDPLLQLARDFAETVVHNTRPRGGAAAVLAVTNSSTVQDVRFHTPHAPSTPE